MKGREGVGPWRGSNLYADLERSLNEALDQQPATSEILQAIGADALRGGMTLTLSRILRETPR